MVSELAKNLKLSTLVMIIFDSVHNTQNALYFLSNLPCCMEDKRAMLLIKALLALEVTLAVPLPVQ